jgi:hypothetical protein
MPEMPAAYFAVGSGGRGLAWAFVLAERLAASVLRDADPTAALFGEMPVHTDEH